MRRFLDALKAIALLAFGALCIAAAICAWSLRTTVRTVSAQSATIASKLDLDLDESHRLILEAGLTAMEARKASAEERASLKDWNVQTSKLLANTKDVLLSLKQTSDGVRASQAQVAQQGIVVLRQTDKAIAGLLPVERQATAAIAELDRSTSDLDAAINDPELKRTAGNVQSMTASGVRVASDAADEADKLVHPKKKKLTFWGSIYVGVEFLHKIEPPLF